MATDTDDDTPPAGPPVPCSACRGTGTVISKLGGDAHDEPCPWCEGGGMRLGTDHDAQRHKREAADAPAPAPDDAA